MLIVVVEIPAFVCRPGSHAAPSAAAGDCGYKLGILGRSLRTPRVAISH